MQELNTPFGKMEMIDVRRLEALGVWKLRVEDFKWKEIEKKSVVDESGKPKWEDVEVEHLERRYDLSILSHEKSYEKINADDTIENKTERLPFAYFNLQWYLFLCDGDLERARKLLAMDPLAYLPTKEGASSYSALFRRIDEQKGKGAPLN